MSNKIKIARSAVKLYLDLLERFNEWADSNLEEANGPQCNLRLDEIKRGYDQFSINQAMIEADDETELEKDTRVRVENLYFLLRPAIEERKEQLLENKRKSAQRSEALPMIAPKLPDIGLKEFSGDIVAWNEFIETFDCLIHNNKTLSDITKFQYLKRSLRESAASAIAALDFTTKNYIIAREILQERFSRPMVICEHHIRCLFLAKPLEKPCPKRLMELLDTFTAHLRSLRSQGRPTDQWDDLIIHMLVNKLDSESRAKWADNSPTDRFATLQDLIEFIKLRCTKLESQPKPPRAPPVLIASKPPRLNHNVSYHASSSKTVYNCNYCRRTGHTILRCNQFLRLTVPDRRSAVEKNQSCFNCLKLGHFVDRCPVNDVCRVCRSKHHTLLHLGSSATETPATSLSSPVPPSNTQPSTSTQSASFTSTEVRPTTSYIFLATALVEVMNKFGNPILGRALLDSGSQLNFISQSFASLLGIFVAKSSADISGIGASQVKSCGNGTVTIRSRFSEFSSNLDVLVLPSIAGRLPRMAFDTTKWSIPSNIKLADPSFNNPQQIDLLIGAELYCELLSIGQIKLAPHLPTLQNTVLGWVVSGGIRGPTTTSSDLVLTAMSTTNLDDQLESFWKLETVPEGSKQITTFDHQCDKHFVKHFSRADDGRFMVRLPFSQEPSILGNSSTLAKRRFLNLEKRLSKDADLHSSYKKFIDEYLTLGHMELIPDGQILASNYFFPHHCVIKPDSSTTKLRVVFDGSAKTTSGKSLNDIMMVGPVVQNDLFSVLCRFRAYKYAFSADISKMYRQIRVFEDDCHYQLIYWRNQPKDDLQIYKLKTVTYGTSSAPFLATRCLLQLALEHETSHPTASSCIRFDTYVDDLLTGANSVSEAICLKSSVIDILTSAGMELRKWCANSTRIIHDVPDADQETSLKIDNDDFVKTLGILWQPTKDIFQCFVLVTTPSSTRLTKRVIISEIARIFDPLGFISPVVILGKIFMQKLWQLKINWDEALPMAYHTEWLAFRNELPCLNALTIPRYLFGKADNPRNIELHGFSDASESAYGVAIYTRIPQSNGTSLMQLLCSKSRVAPLQKTTLARLELCAAQLLAQLMHRITGVINFPVEHIICWSDSTITLHWIKAPPSNWNTFVANRVANIQELTDLEKWFHVKSKSNPADIVSRGLMPEALLQCEMWFSGPEFLKSSAAPWNELTVPFLSKENGTNISSKDIPEQRKSSSLVTTQITTNEVGILCSIKYANSYPILRQIMAFVYRFITNCRTNKSNRKTGYLSLEERNAGLRYIVRLVQSDSFPVEQKNLQTPHFVIRDRYLKHLSLFLDEVGIIRVGGRLQHSSLPYTAKQPMLLHDKHPFTAILIEFIHRKNLHVGPQALLATVRERFWPINGRHIVKQVCRDCVRCRRIRPIPLVQKMGDLPSERVNPAPPFFHVGVDFCGPFMVHYKARGKSPSKSYICVYVCFATKAVHLEVVSDLTAAGFIGAFKRFTATRGLCRKVFSDNGTNFVGAKSELHELYLLLQSSDIAQAVKKMCQEDDVEWKFAPPGSPHFGGLYEAGVKSTKYHLRRVMGTNKLTYEELNTLIKQVEAVLNSRPLWPLSSDPDDIEVLTPGHFLIGRPLNSLPEPDIQNENITVNKRWRLVQQLHQHFWSRWSREYLQQLQHRHNWSKESPNLKIGTFVLLKDENLPPLKWRLGRVQDVHPGPDGLVRVATVKTNHGTYQRPITKICPLPVCVEQ